MGGGSKDSAASHGAVDLEVNLTRESHDYLDRLIDRLITDSSLLAHSNALKSSYQ